MRRVTWTASTFVVLVLIGALATWRIRKENTPEEYTPGEASKDITSALSRPAAQSTPVPLQIVKNTVSPRVADRLVDPGRNLPSGTPEPRFTDVTNAAGLGSFRQFQGSRTSQLPEDMGSGVAWGDFDNDGLDDLFVVSGGGPLDLPAAQRAPSVLYRNLGDGHFAKVEDFPDLRIIGMGAAWGDYNNDGWMDLVVTGYDTIILFRNDHGHLVREKNFPSPKGFWTGASWGDYNRDGYLDLYVCGYVKYKPGEPGASTSSTQFGLEVPFTLNPASYDPERNLLFRNNRNGRFTEVAQELGVANPEGRSLSSLWHDFDGDGWPDLYVANDISENKLYLNHHGTFVDAGRGAWVEEYRGSMGLAAADFDRDGDDDLFISHWIAQGFALYQSLLAEQKGMANGSELHFTDVAANMGIGQPSLQEIGWGTSFVDFDSDGWPDLVVANGSTFEQKETSPPRLTPMPSFLFWNAQGSFFYDLAPWNRSFSKPHVSRGLAVADFNNDGAMDVAIVDQGEGVRLLRNDIAQGNWVEFRLHSRVPPNGAALGFGDGATVIAWTGKVPIRRTVGSSSYLSQDSLRVHIGLGAATKIDRLEVHWLRGRAETWRDLAANNIWEITQGESEAKPFTAHPANLAQANPTVQLDRAGLVQFWEKQHAAMDAMKRERNFQKAAQLFREALAMSPGHEDSHYYLANCLAALNDIPSAIAELDALARINPQNRRAFQRKGELLAAAASSKSQLEFARQSLDAALRLNSEETGTLVLLGQVALAQGNLASAEQRFAHACQANPRAVNVWFLRGYIAWKQRDLQRASAMLDTARNARGRDWKPIGSALEGDVQHRMYSESGFLNVFEQQWDGSPDPTRVFAPLDAYLLRFR
ncbi:MAG: VCBS repeat-containing protein [Acidobacteria bacterium]|nr:VCBS repeat-containing protein [Acidobacteriota bacterium]